jgi:uncharacterized membrane protein YuzA (DUF378 family)
MKTIYSIAYVLLIIGGLNWLLVGLFGWDIGRIFGGQGAIVSKIVYILVGLSAIYVAVTHSSSSSSPSHSEPSRMQGRSA